MFTNPVPKVAQRQHTAQGPHQAVGEELSSPTPLGVAQVGQVVPSLPQLVMRGWEGGGLVHTKCACIR